jgi:1,2-diacylglycerol 3-alpha-glucosyltransferase
MADDCMNILLFSNLYPPVVSGSSMQTCALASALAGQGCQVTVITTKLEDDAPDHEEIDGVHVYRLPCIRLPQADIALNFPWLNITFTPGNQRRIDEIIAQRQPDVLHLHNHMFDLGFSAVRAARRWKLPLALTIHTIIQHPVGLYNLLLYPLDRGLMKLAVVRHADVIICPERTTWEYMEEGFRMDNLVLIPYGINSPPRQSAARVEEVRRKYQLPKGPIILSLGHLHEVRNRHDLVRAMPFIIQKYPDAVLVIAGSVGTPSTGALARQLGVEKSVIFTGAVAHNETLALLQMASLEAHWFQQKDNPQTRTLGIAALEAMSAGKAVLNTADENIYGEGVLTDGQNYLQVRLNEPEKTAQKVLVLLDDPAECTRIGQAARQTIEENFSWPQVVSRTMDIYRQMATRTYSNF